MIEDLLGYAITYEVKSTEYGLQLHRLPDKPGFDVLLLQHFKDVYRFDTSTDCHAAQPEIRLIPIIDRHEFDPFQAAKFPSIIFKDGPFLLDAMVKDLELPAEKLGLTGSPTRVAGVWEFKKDCRSEVLKGNPKNASSDAVARLREWGGL